MKTLPPFRKLFWAGVICASSLSATGFAAGHKISAGAIAANGGSNPITFTSLVEYSYTYVNSARDREFLVGLAPGLGYAVRFQPMQNVSVSLGGVAAVGITPFIGVYGGFGWEFWCATQSICLSLEYRSALAPYSEKRQITGVSSVSLGGTLWSN
ncbi:MAG: hypothetical protein RL189_402 [Pseudomonadota bacterium]|jgi:hypothetical protein